MAERVEALSSGEVYTFSLVLVFEMDVRGTQIRKTLKHQLHSNHVTKKTKHSHFISSLDTSHNQVQILFDALKSFW